MGKKPQTRTSATIKIHFNVGKAEAGGYRAYVERRGRMTKQGAKVKILETKWAKTEAEAKRALNGLRRSWTRKL